MSIESAEVSPSVRESDSGDRRFIISYGGQVLIVRQDVKEVLLQRVRRALADGAAELVPVHHSHGVEMLLIEPGRELRVRWISDSGRSAAKGLG